MHQVTDLSIYSFISPTFFLLSPPPTPPERLCSLTHILTKDHLSYSSLLNLGAHLQPGAEA